MLNWHHEPGTEPTLLFLPAFPFSSEMYRPLIKELNGEYGVLTLDYPGFGESQGASTPQAWTFPMVSQAISSKLDELGLSSVVLCGASMGGYVALDFATRYPKKLSAVILANTQATSDSDEVIEKRNGSIEKIQKQGVEEFAKGFLASALSEERFGAGSDLREFLRQIIVQQPEAAVIGALVAMCARADSIDRLDRVKVPTLVITGSEDTLIPPIKTSEIHEGIEQSQYEFIEGAGHLTPVEAPEEFSQLVRLFLKEFSLENNNEDVESTSE